MAITCYLDTNVFLNVIYNEEPYVRSSALLLKNIQSRRLVGITSSVTETEIALDLGKTGNREKIDQALRLIERMENLTVCPLGSWTARLAVKLVLDSGMTVHDAYHGATAIENKASVFLTRDKSLRDKLKKMIRVSEPDAITAA